MSDLLFRHPKTVRNDPGTPATFTPPVDTTFLALTTAGAGADNRTNLANWLTVGSNATQALNATNYLGTINSANTMTGAAATGAHGSTSGLITASGWQAFGGAFKRSAGNALFVSCFSGLDNTNYAVFDLTLGTVSSSAGTAVGTIGSLGGGWYWCSVRFAVAQLANATAKWAWADTAAHAIPTTAWTSTTGDILLAGPFACTV